MSQRADIHQQNRSPIQETYFIHEDQMTLLDALQQKSSRSRTAAKKLLSTGRVSIDGIPTTLATELLSSGALLTVHEAAPVKPFRHQRIKVLWENEDYVILYKQSGIPTVNTARRDRRDTVLYLLSKYYKEINANAKLFMVNRLDRNTTGFVVFAKNIDAKELLVKEWGRRVTHQIFATCVEGMIEDRSPHTIESVSERKEGRNRYQQVTTAQVRVLKSSTHGNMHVLEVDVERARIFSLRKMLGDQSLSIFGDVCSGSSFMTDHKIALQQVELELTIPKSEERLALKRPFPTHYYTFLKEDRKKHLQ
ncbi:MAG: pseudouridine synthase [Porphyromonas sp.]|nr:pseudouridine synthase [Porphyromonas sp.]